VDWSRVIFTFSFTLQEEVEQPRRVIYHSPTSSAKVKNEWSYNSALPVCLRGGDTDKFIYFFFGGGDYFGGRGEYSSIAWKVTKNLRTALLQAEMRS
jgi:hypothetical protein